MSRLDSSLSRATQHARTITIDDHWYWRQISDFYRLVDNRDKLNVIWTAWDKVFGAAREWITNKTYNHTPESDWFLRNLINPVPLQFFFGTLEHFRTVFDDDTWEFPAGGIQCVQCDVGINRWYIPAEFRDVFALQDFLFNPTISMTKADEGSFTVESSADDNELTVIEFDDEIDYYDIMWATIYRFKSRQEILDRFADLSNYSEDLAELYEEDLSNVIMGLMSCLFFGPLYQRMERGINLLCGYPWSPVDGYVYSIDGDVITIAEPGGLTTYEIENDIGLEWMHRSSTGEWEALEQGDTVGRWEPLTDAVSVETNVTRPDLVGHTPFSAYEFQNRFLVLFNSAMTVTEEEYPIRWTAVMDFVNRLKALPTAPHYWVFIDFEPDLECAGSSYGRIPAKMEISCQSSSGREVMETVITCTSTLDKTVGKLSLSVDSTLDRTISEGKIVEVMSTYGRDPGKKRIAEVQSSYGF